MTGSKAQYLEALAIREGFSFLRFDYSGHGVSKGTFEEGSIGDWAEDAQAVIEAVTDGPQVLVGSSMGGWISLLLARRIPERIAGLVGIAAAPDFTMRMWEEMPEAMRQELMESGKVALPSNSWEEPLRISRRLIEDGRQNLIFDQPLQCAFPVRLLHGEADKDVPTSVALRIMDHVEADDMRLTLVKGAGHRFSEDSDLALLERDVLELMS